MQKFKGIDYYALDASHLGEAEIIIRDTARNFTDNEVMPAIKECFLNETFPSHLILKMGKLGFFGPTLPKKYGGAEISQLGYGVLMRELERGDSAIRSFASVQGALVMGAIHDFGSDEQKNYLLPLLATGEKMGCFGLTEPDAGSNPAEMKTTATKTTNGFVLNGTKYWITNGGTKDNTADIAVIWAKIGGTTGKISGFLVKKGTPGFSAKKITGKLSLRASVTSELNFQNCLIPKTNLLPKTVLEKGSGLESPFQCLDNARYGIAWGAVGAAMDCYETALHYTLERNQFGKPIASYQLVQHKLAWMLKAITRAQAVCYELAYHKDRNEATRERIQMAKLDNIDMACECARMARRMLGAAGITSEFSPMRHMMNLESVYTYEGDFDILMLALGRDITGISAFK